MDSFFEKLKKGMGIEAPEEVEEEIEEKPPKMKTTTLPPRPPASRAPRPKKLRELKIETKPPKSEIKAKEMPEIEEKIEISPSPIREKAPETTTLPPPSRKRAPEIKEPPEGKEKWFEPEGELAIDVYQTETDLVIQSAIAGVKPEDLEISIERDILTVKGSREKPLVEEGDYFTQECYWGPFSREVILPVEVDPNRAEATMKDGILTVRLPKILREKKRRIKVGI